MLTDPVSDYLTRVRNAIGAGHDELEVPASKLKVELSRILAEQGYIAGYDVEPTRVGEAIRWVNAALGVRMREVTSALRDIATARADGCDDFRRDDPVPLFAEFLYYGSRFLATGSTNPVNEGMIG